MRKEQLTKFQNQLDSAIIGYLGLLERKELLAVSIELSASLTKLEPKIQRSIVTIQDTLYASLIVEAHAWLFDRSEKSSNLSLYRMLNLVADTNFQPKHLLKHYIQPPKVVPLGANDSNWQQKYKNTRENEFKEKLTECVLNINELISSKLAVRVKSIRDSMLAHKDGRYDVAGNGHTIQDVFCLLRLMKNILVCLNSLFQRVSYPIIETEKQARINAELFWERLTPT
ncbi:hypothetical protein P3647_15920 [Vibrio parahaemolyticus]|uniref:AbiU2 domain-containing protein n=1 Tax=Vibrio diabolicus TaxID=50719 RepID=UPI00211B1532|nr:hypothetical protein [Vibrio diabolicus]MCG9621266.1 hypothetical protein [Vibrio diabolicus]MDF5206745.1 hypothetical protein [Vibrio parahaemolyticus]MDF5216771.1 hypothetical protein [Vibrio parahaemolyticus]HCG7286878.1 hypothetical protein [Vibrio parahaemolyticus]